MDSKKLVLVDGHSILNRAFYGMPDLTNAAGLHTGAVYGFLNILFKILDEEKADYLTVAFDVHAPTFRHEIYKEYKGTRKSMPEELREQVPLMQEMLRAMRVPLMMLEGYEALRHAPIITKHIETPICETDQPLVDQKKLCFVPILRAGMGMSDGLAQLLPEAHFGHIDSRPDCGDDAHRHCSDEPNGAS